jgi:hypothetical protein
MGASWAPFGSHETALIRNIDDIFGRIDYATERIGRIRPAFIAEVAACGALVQPHAANDKRTAHFVLHLHKKPDLSRVGFEFGEIVHHLRSILDNLIVSIALHTNRAVSRSELKQLSFTIASTEKDWNHSQNNLRALPQAYIDTLKKLQPFNGFGTFKDREDNLLVVLRDLDNHDKHYLQVLPNMNQLTGSLDFSLEFEDEAAAIRAGPPRLTVKEIKFEDGAICSTLMSMKLSRTLLDGTV